VSYTYFFQFCFSYTYFAASGLAPWKPLSLFPTLTRKHEHKHTHTLHTSSGRTLFFPHTRKHKHNLPLHTHKRSVYTQKRPVHTQPTSAIRRLPYTFIDKKHCNTLQHTATRCNTLHTSSGTSVPCGSRVRAGALKATHILSSTKHCNTLQHTTHLLLKERAVWQALAGKRVKRDPGKSCSTNPRFEFDDKIGGGKNVPQRRPCHRAHQCWQPPVCTRTHMSCTYTYICVYVSRYMYIHT